MLSEFVVSVFTLNVSIPATPYLINRADLSGMPVGITTTSAFSHGSILHDEGRLCGEAVVYFKMASENEKMTGNCMLTAGSQGQQ